MVARLEQARAAVLVGDRLAALAALENLERGVGELRRQIKREIAQAAPRGARVVILDAGRPRSL